MKRVLLILFLLITVCHNYSQNYDLIVTTKGDSIACFIDSTSNSTIFYQMKYAGVWINTSIEENETSEVKYQVINNKDYVFKKGSSYIDYPVSSISSMFNIKRNAAFIGFAITALTANYEHIFPLNYKIGISVRGGLGYDFYNKNVIIMGEGNLLVGGIKSFFELGFGYQIPGKFPGFFIIRPGYRYQSLKGFLFKVFPMYFYNLEKNDDWEHFVGVGVAFGYTF